MHRVGKLHHVQLVLRAQQRVDELARGLHLELLVAQQAFAAVDREHDRKRRRRLLVEKLDLLRLAVFKDAEVALRQPAYG